MDHYNDLAGLNNYFSGIDNNLSGIYNDLACKNASIDMHLAHNFPFAYYNYTDDQPSLKQTFRHALSDK